MSEMKSRSSVLRRFVHYPSCLERGITKKSSESLRGTHPQTFGFHTRSRPGKYFSSSFFFLRCFCFFVCFSLLIGNISNQRFVLRCYRRSVDKTERTAKWCYSSGGEKK